MKDFSEHFLHISPKYESGCDCHTCNIKKYPDIWERHEKIWWMICCKVCGNKRCPKATDHNFECNNSNEPGQKGSIYE